MTSRVLVTGATGFVGAHLVSTLAERGDRVAVLSRDPSRARRTLPRASDVVDRATPDSLAKIDAVVNLAGEPVAGRWSAEKKRAIEASRIDGTKKLVAAIAAMPPGERPRVFVSASAIGYYGDRGDTILDEKSAPGSDFLAKVCVGWESAANEARALGVRVVTLRIGLVMGRGGGALEAMRPLFAVGLGGPLGSGAQWWPWVHVDDVIGLLLFALDRADLDGPLDVTAPTPVRQREHARALGRAMHRPALLPAPAFALKTILGDFSVELLASRRVVPTRATELGYRFRYTDLDAALAEAAG